MFMDFWNLCQKHWIAEDTEAYWDSVVKDVNAFGKKYNDSYFAKKIAYLLVEYLEYKSKNKIKD